MTDNTKIIPHILERPLPSVKLDPVQPIALYVHDETEIDPEKKLKIVTLSGLTGGATAAAGAQESTLQAVRDAIVALAPLLGSTDGLETLATTNNALLTSLGTYTDGVENLLSLLNTNTDNLESLLTSLGVTDDNVLNKLEAIRLILSGTVAVADTTNGGKIDSTNSKLDTANTRLNLLATDAKLETVRALLAGTLTVNTGLTGLATDAKLEAVRALLAGTLSTADAPVLAKAEQIRALLAGTLTTQVAAVAPGSATSDIPAGTSTGAIANLGGLSVARLNITGWTTTADISFEVSSDGTTFFPLYDAYGSLVKYTVTGTRAIAVPVGDLLRITSIRARSGIPGAYVNQASTVNVTFITAVI